MPKADLVRVAALDEGRDAGSRPRQSCVDRDALRVAPAALDVALDQVFVDRVEHGLRDLRAGGVVEEHAAAGPLQGRKLRPQAFDRKCLRGRDSAHVVLM